MRASRHLSLFACLCFATASLAACTNSEPKTANFYAIRAQTPSIVQFSEGSGSFSETRLNLPPNCIIWSDHPSQQSDWLALQLVCNNNEVAWAQNLVTGKSLLLLPEQSADSHILAWTDANMLYLRVDTLGNPRIMLADVRTGRFFETQLPFTVYHMDVAPGKLLYVLSNGIGFGSELWRSDYPQPVFRASDFIIAFARFSPNGKQIAFIKMPDSNAISPPGELWLMEADGTNPRYLAPAHAGHGFSPAWSPSGGKISYIDQLQNLAVLDLTNGQTTRLDIQPTASPVWSLTSERVFVPVASGDTMEIWFYEISSGILQPMPNTQNSMFVGWIGSARP
jgi:Tol biopolymer transport system component